VTLLQSIRAATAFAKPIGILVTKSFHYGRERKRVKSLHGTVAQGGNAQRAHLAVLLGDIMPAKWEGFVSVTFEVECLMEFLFIGSPSFIIDTGRFGARVGGHSPHGQQSG